MRDREDRHDPTGRRHGGEHHPGLGDPNIARAGYRSVALVTVVVPRPPADVVRKWQLAPYEDIAHLIAMPHVTRGIIDAVIDDCIRGAMAPQDQTGTTA